MADLQELAEHVEIETSVPDLVFVADDQAARDKFEQFSRNRVVVRDAPDGLVTIYVDGQDHVTYRTPLRDAHLSRDQSTATLAAAAMAAMEHGLLVEEAVALAVLQRQDDHAPTAAELAALPEDKRAAMVFDLMDDGGLPTRVAVGLVVTDGESVLLAGKEDDKAFVPGVFYLPGGKQRGIESLKEAASRELFEETGVQTDNLQLCGYSYYVDRRAEPKVYKFVQYWSQVSAGTVARAADDIITAEWFRSTSLDREALFGIAWSQIYLIQYAHQHVPLRA